MTKRRDIRCSVCDGPRLRNERHDAYYCAACDIWCESVCGEGCDVGFCSGRPERPSQAEGKTFKPEPGTLADVFTREETAVAKKRTKKVGK